MRTVNCLVNFIPLIGSIKIVINTTGRQLSAMIFRNIPDVGMIVSVYTGTHPSIKMRIDKRLITSLHPSLPNQILDFLGSIHCGWVILSNGSGVTIINHEPITITVDQILKTISKIPFPAFFPNMDIGIGQTVDIRRVGTRVARIVGFTDGETKSELLTQCPQCSAPLDRRGNQFYCSSNCQNPDSPPEC